MARTDLGRLADLVRLRVLLDSGFGERLRVVVPLVIGRDLDETTPPTPNEAALIGGIGLALLIDDLSEGRWTS